MVRDPRGGHNRKKIDENFFKIWSPNMAYVLGLIFTDGAILDVRKSSRTCYIYVRNNDKSLLEQVRKAISSSHRITSRKPKPVIFRGKTYLCKETFSLRIGNKIIFQDLEKRGVSPKKSLNMKLPFIPESLFSFFLRGYFDGDGNISIYAPKGRSANRIRVTFISGSHDFLHKLVKYIKIKLKTSSNTLYKREGAFYLRCSKENGLKILSYMYKNLDGGPYLERKYNIFKSI